MVAAALAVITAAVLMRLAVAHPGHEEEDAFEKLLAALKSEGQPCDEVVEIEDSVDVVIVTCTVGAGSSERRVEFRLPK